MEMPTEFEYQYGIIKGADYERNSSDRILVIRLVRNLKRNSIVRLLSYYSKS